jgi:predicted dienelactone hydrolase
MHMKWLRRILTGIVVLICVVAGVAMATAIRTERPVGFQVTQATGPDGKPFAIGVWYPTDARPWPATLALPMLLNVAKDGPVVGTGLPLVVISHGNGGGAVGHADLAMALASAGYVVAAPTHAGDNYADQSAVGSATFFSARTGQLRATLDHMLTTWPGHERIDAARVGGFGLSMGGFTMLTAVGAQPDLRMIAGHCATKTEFFCDVLRHFNSPLLKAGAATAGVPFVADPRIKAAVLAAPGIGFTMGPAALDNVRVPIQLWSAENDDKVGSMAPLREQLGARAEFHQVAGAGHLSFLQPCAGVLRPPAICTDPDGFDRKAFHATMNASVVAFFNKNLKQNQDNGRQ